MALATDPAAAAARPNVVVILADDLGYGDVRCYNPDRSRIPTPQLDRLAREGMRFTDAHSSSGVCSPSRYTLLTGRYHWRTRLQRGIVGLWDSPLIAPDRLTLASLARQRGYRTACIGKWHLGWHWPIAPDQHRHFTGFGGKPGGGAADVATTPTAAQQQTWREVFSQAIGGGPPAAGFDLYFGTDVPNWPPYCFIENDRTVGIPSTFLPPEKLRNNQASLQGPALPGWMLENVLPALIDRAETFIHQAANSTSPFLLYLPLTTPHTPLAVNRQWKNRSGLGSDVADLIMETDAAVGRVLEALKRSGTATNTLVLFTSDNGFAPYVGVRHLESQGHFPSGPLRGYKGDAWEGGHRVPFIARWPGMVPPESVCTQLVHHADLLATLADILQHPLPENAGEDSFSLLPLLRGGDQPVREEAVSQGQNGLFTLRQGTWKFIAGPGGGGGWSAYSAEPPITTPAQLYDLAADLGETRNRFSAEPARVAGMQRRLGELVRAGRSTPGARQTNDVPVHWDRFLTPPTPPHQNRP